jgi:hypothetical protein
MKAEANALHEAVDSCLVTSYFFRQLGLRVSSSLFTDAEDLIKLLGATSPNCEEKSFKPMLKVIQKKMEGTEASISDKELTAIVTPLLAGRGFLQDYKLAVGGSVSLRFIKGVENPADVLTKPRDVMLLADLVDRVSMRLPTRLECVSNSAVGPLTGEREKVAVYEVHDESLESIDDFEVNENGEFVGGEVESSEEENGQSMPHPADSNGYGANRARERSDGNRAAMGEQERMVDERKVANRTSRTPYGLRSADLLKQPDRLVFLLSNVVDILRGLMPGFGPDVPIEDKGTM